MINYIEIQRQLEFEITELQNKINDLVRERRILMGEKKVVCETISRKKQELRVLNIKKEELLTYRYEFLVNIVAGLPSFLITLLPLLVTKIFLFDDILQMTGIIYKAINVIFYTILSTALIIPIVDIIFNSIRNLLLKKHFAKLANSKEYKNVLKRIEVLNSEIKLNENIELDKLRGINKINDTIKSYNDDISEIRTFLNFIESKNIVKETSIHLDKKKSNK